MIHDLTRDSSEPEEDNSFEENEDEEDDEEEEFFDNRDDDEEEEEEEDDFSEGEELPFHDNFMNQINSMLLAGASGNQEDMERIRAALQAQLAQGMFGMISNSGSVVGELKSLLRQLNAEAPIETLFVVFSQIWEQIVLAGEQIGAQDFDSVVDLRPLIGPLLRVLNWDGECQLLGLEFLLVAVKCARGVIQYSPQSSRRLVDAGMIPLLTQQLQQVEYIDLAEDLIFILQMLSRPGAYPRACLHANGLSAVLGFVDFFSLPVQISAFTAAAQMCTAVTPESSDLYLTPDLLVQLKGVISNRRDEPKLVHWALLALLNAKALQVFTEDFLLESVYPLATTLPADLVSLLSSLCLIIKLPSPIPIKTLLDAAFRSNGSVDELLLESLLATIVLMLPHDGSFALKLICEFCNRIVPSSSGKSNSTIDPSLIAQLLLQVLLTRSASLSRLQLREVSVVLLLALEANSAPQSTSLQAWGLISRFLGDDGDDLFIRIVGLFWCHLALKDHVQVARRQGILAELQRFPLSQCEDFLANLSEIPSLSSMLKEMIVVLSDSQSNTCSVDIPMALASGEITEFEMLGDLNDCLARKLLQTDRELLVACQANDSARIGAINLLQRALLRYAGDFFPAKLPQIRGNSLAEQLMPLLRPIRLRLKLRDGPIQQIATSPLLMITTLISQLEGSSNQSKTPLSFKKYVYCLVFPLNRPSYNITLNDKQVRASASIIEAIYLITGNWEPSVLWSVNPLLVIDESPQSKHTISPIEIPERVSMALDLLRALHSGPSNQLSALLNAALDNPLLTALNAIPRAFIHCAQTYPFIFPFSQRIQLMRQYCFDRFRSLTAMKNRANPGASVNEDLIADAQSDLSRLTRVIKKKFVVKRDRIDETITSLFSPDSPFLADSRAFEFEYDGELGTGQGPTLEFYALVSQYFNSSSSESLMPDWNSDSRERFFQIGAFMARALLDDRIVDLPLPECLLNEDEFTLSEIDPQLDVSLNQSLGENELAEAALEFPQWSNRAGTAIKTRSDWQEYGQEMRRIVSDTISTARESLFAGFDAVSPTSLAEIKSFFSTEELAELFCPRNCEWTTAVIAKSLIPDHGYSQTSPQLGWLAELIAECEDRRQRAALIRFLTGAAYLPVGGWSVVKLTIVSKAFESSNSNGSTDSVDSGKESTKDSSQDGYLPSVMTCANYLKLPRYSSKEIMRERLWYAVSESNNSFYLS